MTPDPDTGFAARVREVCPGFVGLARLPARKSEVLLGTLGDARVIAKRPAKPDPVWAWYFARERALYRAGCAGMPALVAEREDLLVVAARPGEPLATLRDPQATLAPATLERLLDTLDALGTIALPVGPRPAATVRAQLRRRFLEDPTEDWIARGVDRATRTGLVSRGVGRALRAALVAYPVMATCHGDLLLRNVIGDAGLVDWECAGTHRQDWDRALLATQLATDVIEHRVAGDAARHRCYLALVAFALVREIAFLDTFRVPPTHPGLARRRSRLRAVTDRVRSI